MFTRRARRLFLSLAVASVLLAGCGDDDSSGDTDAKQVDTKTRSTPTAQSSVAAFNERDADDVLANIKFVVATIEACAAGNVDGSYKGCGDPKRLKADEPGLAELDLVTDAPGPDAIRAELDPNATAYLVQGMVPADGDSEVFFTQASAPDGTIFQICSQTAVNFDTLPKSTAPADDPQPVQRGCPDGTWPSGE